MKLTTNEKKKQGSLEAQKYVDYIFKCHTVEFIPTVENIHRGKKYHEYFPRHRGIYS